MFQNTLLLFASYYFYASWDYRFLLLLIFSTLLDYITGKKIFESGNSFAKNIWFWLSITFNLGFLCIFKYYNFFISSFSDFIKLLGLHTNVSTLEIILPVGISFYTFHGLSYVIDIFKNRISPESNLINYSLFVSFFPLLVAGPIERATHLLPQISNKREFKHEVAVDGLRQILWGLFKKIVIADNCAEFVNSVFANYSNYPGGTLALGAIFFSFQIYCDFSGYSDIAIGTAKLFGIELLQNFNFPYFSRNIAEFWRRWHISLSSWFKDYLYIPLGGNNGTIGKKIRNVFIIFVVSGFWHGANWTFILWGILNAIYFLPLLIFKKNRNYLEIVAKGRNLPTINEFISMSFTFILSTIAWIFFRAKDVSSALDFISKMASNGFFVIPKPLPLLTILFISFFIVVEWFGREGKFALSLIKSEKSLFVRWVFYFVIIICIFMFGGKQEQFIYFQF